MFIDFFKRFGYGLRSGPFLARRMVHIADIQDADVILELGGGEGQITKYILEYKNPSTRLIVVENDSVRYGLPQGNVW